MDLMRLLRSLEEFLYELIGWLVFYPRTFWRILRNPGAIARYTQLEMEQPPENQFTETISPVLMLILSVTLAHALELVSKAPLPQVDTPAGRMLFGSEQGLLLTRSVAFCLYALLAALSTLRRQRTAITRDTLRTPFSIQAFLVSPFVVLLSAGFLMARGGEPWQPAAGWSLAAGSCLWYVWARASAYRAVSRAGWGKALVLVSLWFTVSTLAIVALMVAVGVGDVPQHVIAG
jgi:hypothetical protein